MAGGKEYWSAAVCTVWSVRDFNRSIFRMQTSRELKANLAIPDPVAEGAFFVLRGGTYLAQIRDETVGRWQSL